MQNLIRYLEREYVWPIVLACVNIPIDYKLGKGGGGKLGTK